MSPLNPLDQRSRHSLGIARRTRRRRRDALDLGAIKRGAAAPVKRRGVHGDRFAIEHDRLLDRRRRQRDGAELVGIADQKQVRADRLAEQSGGDTAGVDEMGVVGAGVGGDGALEALARQREIGIAGEVAGQELGGVDDHVGRAVLHRGENFARAGDDDVAAEDEIGAAGGDADGMDIFGPAARCGCS